MAHLALGHQPQNQNDLTAETVRFYVLASCGCGCVAGLSGPTFHGSCHDRVFELRAYAPGFRMLRKSRWQTHGSRICTHARTHARTQMEQQGETSRLPVLFEVQKKKVENKGAKSPKKVVKKPNPASPEASGPRLSGAHEQQMEEEAAE